MEGHISNKVFVGNLSYDITDQELLQMFSTIGAVVRARVIMDRETGKSRGFGIVEFGSDALAAEAIRRLHNQPLKDRPMRVNDADDKPQKRAPQLPPVASFSGFEDPGWGGGGGGGGEGRRFKAKGSMRNIRKRKRSL